MKKRLSTVWFLSCIAVCLLIGSGCEQLKPVSQPPDAERLKLRKLPDEKQQARWVEENPRVQRLKAQIAEMKGFTEEGERLNKELKRLLESGASPTEMAQAHVRILEFTQGLAQRRAEGIEGRLQEIQKYGL